MGLDSFLNKQVYISKLLHKEIKVLIDGKQHDEIIPNSNIRVIQELGYWREARHIHNWFVENVQDGEDDCDDYLVTEEQLEELLNTCKQALEAFNKGDFEFLEENLPTSNGLYYESTEPDDFYKEMLVYTIKLIEKIFEDRDEDGNLPYRVYYESSW